jgi:hypothetical protein
MSSVEQTIGRPSGTRRGKDLAFRLALVACLALAIGLLAVLLVDVTSDGIGTISWDFINNFTSIQADKAGIQAALWGTIWLMGVCALFIVPVGVATAIYLEEYADANRWWNKLIELNIQNLAAVWDEVKDRLKSNAFGMSGGQQQRLCIARALAVEPDVILMDEPCSALDPISTGKIEDLMMGLRERYSIVIVTHNMQQAARVSDRTAFFTVDPEDRVGRLVEYDDTETVFTNPSDERTEAYVTGRVG